MESKYANKLDPLMGCPKQQEPKCVNGLLNGPRACIGQSLRFKNGISKAAAKATCNWLHQAEFRNVGSKSNKHYTNHLLFLTTTVNSFILGDKGS
ncbi:hypothetical protein CCACVL1_22012 [Corchorus capsularis]|uniref:Uncharacterized protein n=1 Tax=Corchorus capsularis TaxID=210143 RepID=A0A1R3H1P5_COCAP|nr:hypothetical protein CCACVL1_22012 [Corchorus capsularis]